MAGVPSTSHHSSLISPAFRGVDADKTSQVSHRPYSFRHPEHRQSYQSQDRHLSLDDSSAMSNDLVSRLPVLPGDFLAYICQSLHGMSRLLADSNAGGIRHVDHFVQSAARGLGHMSITASSSSHTEPGCDVSVCLSRIMHLYRPEPVTRRICMPAEKERRLSGGFYIHHRRSERF